jgi:membrane protein DedA with SNARE-associated domain
MIASITGSITSAIGSEGLYAVFGLMVLSAVLPAASELTMLYGGAIASGAIHGASLSLFGHHISTPFWGFVAVALAGTLGTTLGALVGWTIGYVGERQFLERHGRWLHITPEKLDRAHGWFERHGDLAVPLGLALPLIRSFIAIPAGVARMPLARFLPLAALGSAVFCLVFAGIGWALGSSWDSVHNDVRIVEYVIIGLAGAGLIYLAFRRYSSRLTRRAHDPAD